MTGDSGAESPDFSYVLNLSRGGPTMPSTNLANYVCTAFAVLEFVDDLITKSGLTIRYVAEHALIHCFQSFQTFACTTHQALAQKITNSSAIDIYFNNKRKISTDSVAADGMKTFKKRQREKNSY